jgi:hypothetical protein
MHGIGVMRTRVLLGGFVGAMAAAAVAGIGCGDDAVFEGSVATGSGAQGTTSQGGSGGQTSSNGGSSSVGGSGGGVTFPQPECMERTDCQLVNTCCDCMGYPASANEPPCVQQCIQDKCQELGFNAAAAACEVGRCVLDVSCNAMETTCDTPPPNCPAGYAASVVEGCWGECIPVTECARVTSCDACSGGLDVCVAVDTQLGRQYHCVDVLKGCEGTPDCACMGSTVCLGAFDTCNDVPMGGMACSCPNC